MMKFLIVIAMFALIGFSSTSAATIDLGNNDMPDSIEAYQSVLESMLRDASKLITENAAVDENMDFESFAKESMFDDKQSVIVTEEELGEAADDERSTLEDNHSAEGVGSGIRCRWRGLTGQCCQSLRIARVGIRICLGIQVALPAHMHLYLKINGRTIWSQSAGVRQRSFNICFRRGPAKICIHLYNLYISRHNVRVCVAVSARVMWFRYRKSLGCITRRFALNEIPTTTSKLDLSNLHEKHDDTLPPREYIHNNDVVRFEQ